MALALLATYDATTAILTLQAGGYTFGQEDGLVYWRRRIGEADDEEVGRGSYELAIAGLESTDSGVHYYFVELREIVLGEVTDTVLETSPEAQVLVNIRRNENLLSVALARCRTPASVPLSRLISAYVLQREAELDFAESNFRSADDEARRPVI